MLNLIVLTSLFTLGLYITGSQNYFLNPIQRLLASLLGGVPVYYDGEWEYEFNKEWVFYLWKPVWGCPPCMCSVWGTILYSCFIDYSVNSIYELPVVIVCSSGLNFIIFNNIVKKYLKD